MADPGQGRDGNWGGGGGGGGGERGGGGVEAPLLCELKVKESVV